MKNDFYYLSADGKTRIHAMEWLPEGKPRAILQLNHGMCEFIDRYDPFSSYLAQQGFYVTGNDHLGHGQSVISEDLYGYFNETDGNGCLISDIHTLRKMTQEKYPDLPYFMFGHSMGSFLTRQYLEMYGAGLTGAIIAGTGSYPGIVLQFGLFLCRILAVFKGWKYRSTLVSNLATGNGNKAFEPVRTIADWLTRDEQVVDQFLSNPCCTFTFTLNGYYNMFLGMKIQQKKKNIAKIPKDLPLLIASGECDPVGDFGKGVRKVYQTYLDAGIKDIKMKLYPQDRHEILNELDRDQVFEDLYNWLTNYI